MAIQSVTLTDFRSFDNHCLSFSSGLNLIIGPNGSGKTSVLESIYMFGYARSFRTSLAGNLIKNSKPQAVVHVKSSGDGFGWSRSQAGDVKYQLNQAPIGATDMVRRFPPCLFIDASSHRAFNKQTTYRRQLLDWGVYHADEAFGSTWNIYQRALKQRNAAIKSRRHIKEITQWDPVLIENACAIKSMRKKYIEQLKLYFKEASQALAISKMCPALKLAHGWSGDYASSLMDHLEDDCRIGYTSTGPHRAKVDILVNSVIAKNQASEGQQKLLHYALRLAQAKYLYALNGKKVVFLIDDFGAELDEVNQCELIKQYKAIDTQLIVTNIHQPLWQDIADNICDLSAVKVVS